MKIKDQKILMLNYEFPPLGSGAGNATYYLLKEFSGKKNIKIDLVTSSVGKYRKKKFSKNINIYFLDIGKQGNLQHQSLKDLLVYSWKAYKFSKKLSQKNNYILVHAFFGIPCGFVAMFLEKPFIVSLRGSDVPFYSKKFKWLDIFVFQWLSKIIWWKASSVIANSSDLKKLALRTYSKKEIGVIPNGVDLNEFKQKITRNSQYFNVLSTSRITQRKGIVFLIKAVENLVARYPNIRLNLFGDGDQKREFESYAKDNKLDKNIIFHGRVGHDKIVRGYQNSDVFVLPSFNEGMSNSLLEALASGLALISTDTGGAKDLIDKSNGFIIEMGSIKEIEKSLEVLIKNKLKLKSTQKASRKKALNFSWSQVAGKYFKMYRNV